MDHVKLNYYTKRLIKKKKNLLNNKIMQSTMHFEIR